MKIAIYGVDSFLGSNMSNYFIQHTSDDILGIFLTDGPYHSVEPSIRSRSRFSSQFHSAGDTGLDKRLIFENPQTILCFGSVPSQLKERKDIILLTSDPYESATRTMLLPKVFGPRLPATDDLAKIFLSDESFDKSTLSHKKESFLYVKDVYVALQDFIKGDRKFVALPGYESSEASIYEFVATGNGVVPTELEASITHTKSWYSGNTWIKK